MAKSEKKVRRPEKKTFFYTGDHKEDQTLSWYQLTQSERVDAKLDVWTQTKKSGHAAEKMKWKFMFRDMDDVIDMDFERMRDVEDESMENVEDLMVDIADRGLKNAVVGTEGNHRKVAYQKLKLKKIPYLSLVREG
jgi:hypothetical protein